MKLERGGSTFPLVESPGVPQQLEVPIVGTPEEDETALRIWRLRLSTYPERLCRNLGHKKAEDMCLFGRLPPASTDVLQYFSVRSLLRFAMCLHGMLV